jgi:hypothetical protein
MSVKRGEPQTLRKEGARELEPIVFDRRLPDVSVEVSHLRDNYNFFLEKIRDNALEVWSGLQRLEHVAITLQQHANPQQVFESLNSTRTPLRNHELIHNYILMGLTYAQQTEIEDSFWVPIEANTGDAIDSFLRDYLTLKTGRDSDFAGEHGVYDDGSNQISSRLNLPREQVRHTLLGHVQAWNRDPRAAAQQPLHASREISARLAAAHTQTPQPARQLGDRPQHRADPDTAARPQPSTGRRTSLTDRNEQPPSLAPRPSSTSPSR